MNLNDLLKVNNVRCVKTKVDEDLVEGKSYKVEGFDDETIKIVDRGFSSWHNKNLFEPVLNNDVSKSDNEIDTSLDSVNDFNGVDDVNTTFKGKQEFSVGDKVYVGLTGKIAQVTKIIDDNVVSIANKNNEVRVLIPNICHATQENYEMLCKLYQHIEFELPHKEITGSDLCRAMLNKGWNLVPCVVSDISDSDALNNDNVCLVDEWWFSSFGSCFNSGDYSYKYAVPFDPKTGVPLTEDVLNETI